MIVDGKALALEILDSVSEQTSHMQEAPRLGIITCAPNFETQKYLALKEKKANEVGIKTEVVLVPETSTTEAIIKLIGELCTRTDGIIVQLPLPPSINAEQVITSIPVSHDVDALNPDTTRVLSPVIAAIVAIIKKYELSVSGKYVTIIGSGRLVGLPAYQWFTAQGSYVSVVTKDTTDIVQYTQNADIIVCGAGSPGLLTPDMVKDGVIILDAGTSEDGGVLKGDADPACASKASLFTPVPGGIGPITIAVLLQNVVALTQ